MAFVHLLTCWYLLSGVFSRDLPVVPVGRECKEEICSIEYKGPGLYTFSKVYPHLERVEIDRFAKSRLDISNTPNLNRVSIVWSSGLPSISCQVLQNVDHCLTLEIEDREIRCCSSTTHEAESTKAPTTEAPNTEVSTAKTPTPEALNTEVSTAKTPTPEASRQTPSTGDASYDTDPTTEGDTSTGATMNKLLSSVLLLLAFSVQTTEGLRYPLFRCDVHTCNSGGEYEYCSSEKYPRCLRCKDMRDQDCFTNIMPNNCSYYCHEETKKVEREQQCPRIELSNGSHNASTNPSFGENVDFKCNYGYKLKGPNVIICFDGRWLPDLPTCEAILCSVPTVSKGAISDYNLTMTVGTWVTYQCEDGFRAVDQEGKARCMSDGTWQELLCIPSLETKMENIRKGGQFFIPFIVLCVITVIMGCVLVTGFVWYKCNKRNVYKVLDSEDPAPDTDDTNTHTTMDNGVPESNTTNQLHAKPLPPREKQSDNPVSPDEAKLFFDYETKVKTCDSESESDSEGEERTDPAETTDNNESPKVERPTDSSDTPEATEGTPPTSNAEKVIYNVVHYTHIENNGSNNTNNGICNTNTHGINIDNNTTNTGNTHEIIVEKDTCNTSTDNSKPKDNEQKREDTGDIPYPVQISEDDSKPETTVAETAATTSVITADGARGQQTETSNTTVTSTSDISNLHAQPCDRTGNAKLALTKNTVDLNDIKRKLKRS